MNLEQESEYKSVRQRVGEGVFAEERKRMEKERLKTGRNLA